MIDDALLYAGTASGLQVLRLAAGGCELVSEAFPGATVLALSTDPSGKVFVGLHDGLYRGNEDGSAFQRVLEGDVRSVRVDPSDGRVLYAGIEPVHLYRSEDGGDTWAELTSLLALPEQTHERLGETEPLDMDDHLLAGFRHRRQDWWGPRPPHNGHILDVFVHPDDPSFLLLCIEHGGLACSTDGGESWEDASDGIDYLDIHHVAKVPGGEDRYLLSSARGLYSAADPRKGWVRAERGCDRDYFHDIVFVPDGEGSTAIVATGDGSPGVWRRAARGSRAALFSSADAGGAWRRIGVGRGLAGEMDAFIWSLCSHPGTGTVFAGIGEATNFAAEGEVAAATPGSIVASDDLGESWQVVRSATPTVGYMSVTAR